MLNNMSLFQKGEFLLHSGESSNFKIDCDALTDDDWDCLAYLISKEVSFDFVIGVPTGGNKLAKALNKYKTNTWTQTVLIVDDVFTTGKSMEDMKIESKKHDPIVYDNENNLMETTYKGFVVFSRGNCPSWITPLFQLSTK